MALVLNEEQRLLRDTAREFLDQRAPVAALRRLRDSGDPLGYDADLWREMSEMGWAGIVLPEAYGGLEFGFTGLGVVLEETGRSLTASPLLASTVGGHGPVARRQRSAEGSTAASRRRRRRDPGAGAGGAPPSSAVAHRHPPGAGSGRLAPERLQDLRD